MGDWQNYGRGVNARILLPGILYGHSGHRQIRAALPNSYPEDAYRHRPCLWKSGHHLCCPGSASSLGFTTDEMAGAFDVRRRAIHLSPSQPWLGNGSVVFRALGNSLGSVGSLLDDSQYLKDSDLQIAQAFLDSDFFGLLDSEVHLQSDRETNRLPFRPRKSACVD